MSATIGAPLEVKSLKDQVLEIIRAAGSIPIGKADVCDRLDGMHIPYSRNTVDSILYNLKTAGYIYTTSDTKPLMYVASQNPPTTTPATSDAPPAPDLPDVLLKQPIGETNGALPADDISMHVDTIEAVGESMPMDTPQQLAELLTLAMANMNALTDKIGEISMTTSTPIIKIDLGEAAIEYEQQIANLRAQLDAKIREYNELQTKYDRLWAWRNQIIAGMPTWDDAAPVDAG